jgi:hypothetical protein
MLWHTGQGGGHTAGHMRNVSEDGDVVRLLHRLRGCQPRSSHVATHRLSTKSVLLNGIDNSETTACKRQAQKRAEHEAQRTQSAWLGPWLRLSSSIIRVMNRLQPLKSPANQGLQAIQNRITLLTLILTQKARHLTLALQTTAKSSVCTGRCRE